tara:strand:- start:185 stop:709 length:525 start_codon:yes stop_codon:yes gene_type:complete
MKYKSTQVTQYKGFKKIYFDKIIKEIIKIGNLNSTNLKILDYGCGEKRLEQNLERKIFNFDINEKYSEVSNFLDKNFDIMIINHVLMYMSKDEINKLFNDIYSINSNCKFIIGIGKQNLFSKFAKNISLNFNAHSGTISSYNDQYKIIENKMKIIKKRRNIFFMTDIFLTQFKL